MKKFEEIQPKFNICCKDFDDPEQCGLKILVFTEFRTTQRMLTDFFRNKGYSVSFIHGGQDLDERKRALAQFRNETQILVATEAAGESLNMQFCHIVFNYDLPWNPMVIEQRIGRVDRIGQKQPVKAFNMLTDNSVDLRVYEIIEEKLNRIIDQLGIDKTSDVLDSTIEMKKVNKLYLQSLLDPEKLEFAGERWLYEIKGKLREYKSTERVLPQVPESEIEYKKAADIKHSPLPFWLEMLVRQYTLVKNGSMTKTLYGFSELKMGGETRKITFDAEISLNHPEVEHLTLQHDLVKKILNDHSVFDPGQGIPVIESKSGDETPGYWSLWQVSAKNALETRLQYHCYFIADNGKEYASYANDIWNRLISDEVPFMLIENHHLPPNDDIQAKLDRLLFISFQNMEAKQRLQMDSKYKNRIKSYNFQQSRIEKIGIENIRRSRLRKLEMEHSGWLKEFESNKSIIPGIKQLLMIRIDG